MFEKLKKLLNTSAPTQPKAPEQFVQTRPASPTPEPETAKPRAVTPEPETAKPQSAPPTPRTVSPSGPVIPRSRIQVCTGSVSCLPGKGALAAGSYCLDITQQTEWHIGRGASSRRAGVYRDNDIVVDDLAADPEMRRLNALVSSSQADILYQEGRFWLRATRYGCRLTGGAPTKVLRKGKKSELTSTDELFELRNGDLIELGRSVVLTFNCL